MAWVPEKHAVIERFLRLTEAGVSEDGWEVLGAGTRRGSSRPVIQAPRDIRR